MKYGIDMSLKDILDEPRCCEVFDKFLPGMRRMVASQPMAGSLSVRMLAKYSQGAISEDILQKLDEALQEYNDGSLSPTEKRKVEAYQKLWEEDRKTGATVSGAGSQGEKNNNAAGETEPSRGGSSDYNAIRLGKIWRDTNGKPIQAHAGQIFFEDGFYYWYGENKEHTDGKTDIWAWGIRCYSSRNLYNWEDLGLIIEPDLEHPDSALFPDQHLDRPHIIKSKKTGKYICWVKLSGVSASFVILAADCITGPYEIVKQDFRPLGIEAGDFDLYYDFGKEKVYLFESGNHDAVCGMELSDDCTEVTRLISKQYEGLKPPFTREGICLFEEGGKVYTITSGMSGYLPNQSDTAVTDDIEKPFVSIGNPHVGDKTKTSFHSQLSQVFRIPGTDKLVSIADRGVTDHLLNAEEEDRMVRVIGASSDLPEYSATEDEKKVVFSMPAMDDTKVCTRDAGYVWLPVDMKDGKPVITWKDICGDTDRRKESSAARSERI